MLSLPCLAISSLIRLLLVTLGYFGWLKSALGSFGQIWSDPAGSNQIWLDLAGSGQIGPDPPGSSRIRPALGCLAYYICVWMLYLPARPYLTNFNNSGLLQTTLDSLDPALGSFGLLWAALAYIYIYIYTLTCHSVA